MCYRTLNGRYARNSIRAPPRRQFFCGRGEIGKRNGFGSHHPCKGICGFDPRRSQSGAEIFVNSTEDARENGEQLGQFAPA